MLLYKHEDSSDLKVKIEIINKTCSFTFLSLHIWVFELCICREMSVKKSAYANRGQRHRILFKLELQAIVG